MISQRIKGKFHIYAIPISIVILLFILVPNTCAVKHVTMLGDIDRYYESLDPEMCEMLVHRINSFNDECKPVVEILDCG